MKTDEWFIGRIENAVKLLEGYELVIHESLKDNLIAQKIVELKK